MKNKKLENPDNSFYEGIHADTEKSYTLCSQLGWSHARLIMRIDNSKIRKYYLKETLEQNWSVSRHNLKIRKERTVYEK